MLTILQAWVRCCRVPTQTVHHERLRVHIPRSLATRADVTLSGRGRRGQVTRILRMVVSEDVVATDVTPPCQFTQTEMLLVLDLVPRLVVELEDVVPLKRPRLRLLHQSRPGKHVVAVALELKCR